MSTKVLHLDNPTQDSRRHTESNTQGLVCEKLQERRGGVGRSISTFLATVPEAGSAVEADTPVKSVPAWEPRANDTREKAGPPAAGKDETSRNAPGGE